LYDAKDLKSHIKSGSVDDASFKGHPDCVFCATHFYSYDELYSHCREAHEQCFLCQRAHIRNQYFANYDTLVQHFHEDHFPCEEKTCIEQKFVVFGSKIDLEAHRLEVHTTGKLKSKGRAINLDFDFGTPSSRQDQSSSRNRQRSEDAVGPSAIAQNMNNQSSLAVQQGPRIRAPEGFGSQLTPSVPSQPNSTTARVSTRLDPTPLEVRTVIDLTPAQEGVLNGASAELLSNLSLVFPLKEKIDQLKIHIEAFKSGKSTADLFLKGFIDVYKSQGSNVTHSSLVSLSKAWQKLTEIFPEDEQMMQIYENLSNKAKKKGLSLQEFEQMKAKEPKKTAMLRSWNNFKVKVFLY
jgi:hypothetical protein